MHRHAFTRREFLSTATQLTGALMLGPSTGSAGSLAKKTLPQRILGRTRTPVSILGLGLGPLGLADYPPEELRAVAEAALDEGINYFDVQPNYGEAESHLAPLLRRRRREVFLVTKTWEQTSAGVITSIENSLRRLGVESLDAVLLNNIALFDLAQLFSPGGALAGLKEAQKRGWVRFLGLSGHMGTASFARALERGEFDIAMPVVNFVYRHTYNFEGTVLPVATKLNVGVAAMKVLGGAVPSYETHKQRARVLERDYEPAIRHALNVPGVVTAVIGCKSIEEVRRAVEVARGRLILSPEEREAVSARGKELAADWGLRLGPV